MTETLSNLKPNTNTADMSAALDVFNALGIDVWLPRQQLTGNVAEHICYSHASAYSVEHQPIVESGSSAVSPQGASRAADLSALMQSDSPNSSPQSSSRVSNRANATNDAAVGVPNKASSIAIDQAPALEWLCLFYKDWLFVDDATGANTVKSVYTDWIQSLLFSLGLYADEQAQAFKIEPPIRRIKWPPAQGLEKSLATSKAHGALQREVLSDQSKERYVEAWFERQRGLLGREINFVVLMGKEPSDTLLKNKTQNACLDIFPSAKVVSVPSSKEIWAQPDKKKHLWKMLADLHRKLD